VNDSATAFIEMVEKATGVRVIRQDLTFQSDTIVNAAVVITGGTEFAFLRISESSHIKDLTCCDVPNSETVEG